MAVKRKYQGPPYILAKTELGASRALSIGMVRQLGLMALQNEDEMPPKGVNPLPFLEMHNLKATEKWLFVHLPHADPSKVENLDQFVDLEIAGQHTDRFDWSFVSELNRIAKPKLSAPPHSSEPSQSLEFSESEVKCSLESLCASETVLESQNYPLTGTKLDRIAGSREGYAVDCEMCMAGSKQVLTRIAVVRFRDGKKLLDELVKPEAEITDYVTKYSGITAEMLANATLSLNDVHEWLQTNIGSTDILIGHSLNNDLNVLRITHPHIVDTALCFPHYLGPSYHSSLRYLSRKFLNHEIQTSLNGDGHDPVEDATTCEQLVKWLMINGPAFTKIDVGTTMAFSTKLSSLHLRSTIIADDLPAFDADGTASHLVANDAETSIDLGLRALKTSEFVCVDLPNSIKLNEQLNRLVTNAPPRTLIMLCFGSAYSLHQQIQQLRTHKTEFAKEFRTKKLEEIADPWTAEDDALLKQTIRDLGQGRLFLQISLSLDDVDQWPEQVKRKYNARSS